MGSSKKLELEEDLDLESDIDLESDMDLDGDLDDEGLDLDEQVSGNKVLQSSSKRVRMIFSVMASPNRIDILRILNCQ